MVDALGYQGEEGRGVPAKSVGEVVTNLWPGDVRMGKPSAVKTALPVACQREQTRWSETSQ